MRVFGSSLVALLIVLTIGYVMGSRYPGHLFGLA